MDSYAALLLSELRRCSPRDRLQVARALLDPAELLGPPPTEPALDSTEELAEVRRRLATLDDACGLDEFMKRLDQAVAARSAGS
jgi:hypothetical protein